MSDRLSKIRESGDKIAERRKEIFSFFMKNYRQIRWLIILYRGVSLSCHVKAETSVQQEICPQSNMKKQL